MGFIDNSNKEDLQAKTEAKAVETTAVVRYQMPFRAPSQFDSNIETFYLSRPRGRLLASKSVHRYPRALKVQRIEYRQQAVGTQLV